jgi:hypothetical protein
MVEVAEEVGERRHLPMDDHQLPARIDQCLPLIAPYVAHIAVFDAVERVAHPVEAEMGEPARMNAPDSV